MSREFLDRRTRSCRLFDFSYNTPAKLVFLQRCVFERHRRGRKPGSKYVFFASPRFKIATFKAARVSPQTLRDLQGAPCLQGPGQT